MIIAEILMGLGLLCVLVAVGYGCFKLGEFVKRKETK